MQEKIIAFEYPSDWQELEIYPLSDLHIGDPRTDIQLFRSFVKMVAEKENRRVIYNGDNLNNAIKTSISNVYNETMSPNEQRKWLAAELMPIKDKILCFVEGNHEHRSTREVDLSAVEWLANQLGCEHYRENDAYLKISLGKGADGKRITYAIYVTHGAGGGGRIGASLNRAEDTVLHIEGADVIIMGHVHKKGASKPGYLKMDLRNNLVTEGEKLTVISSHWSSFGGYAARKMLRPSSKGAVPIILSGRRKEMLAVV